MPIIDLESSGEVVYRYQTELRSAITKAAASWKNFCQLPEEKKTRLPYSNSSAGVGYELKDGSGYKMDRKENFDITTAGEAWLRQRIAAMLDPAVHAFTEDAITLVKAVRPLVLEFAQQVEAEYGIQGFVDEVAASEDAFFIRFIHYFGDRKVGEEICVPHVDQSGFTPHLYESAPGLQRLTYEDEWVDMPVSEGETVVIPAIQMQLRSEGALRALCHRYSAVCFVQLKNTPKYDKETWGRLQEREAGFNYSLPHNEFKTLFKL